MKPIQLEAAAGVRNDVPLERFTPADLSAGTNIDIDETGAITRRLGTQVVASGAAHSLWSGEDKCYYVQGGALKRLREDTTSITLRTGIAGNALDFTHIAGRTFWSDGLEAGTIFEDHASQWGVTPPAPVTVSITPGNMLSGRYGITTTFLRADGHESGARAMNWFDVPEYCGLSLNLSPSTNPDVVAQRVYVTAPDGETGYLAGEVPNGTLTFDINVLSQGVACPTLFMVPPPAGQLVGQAFGRTYVARDNYLFYSESFRYELFDLRSGFLGFSERVTMFAPVSDGIYLGTTERVVFLNGTNPKTFQMQTIFPFGAVEGTAHMVRGDVLAKENEPTPAVLWLSKKGVCVGMSGGQAKNLTGDRYIMPASLVKGASLLKIKRGTPHFVITTN